MKVTNKVLQAICRGLGIGYLDDPPPKNQAVESVTDYSYVDYKDHVTLTETEIIADNCKDLVTADYYDQCDFWTACGKRWDRWRAKNQV